LPSVTEISTEQYARANSSLLYNTQPSHCTTRSSLGILFRQRPVLKCSLKSAPLLPRLY
jgi:hypothetical protein